MNYVESFNLLGVEAKQIPCIKGEGVPTASTEGAIGCFYMDTISGTLYKCVAVSSGTYTWETFEGIKEIVQIAGDSETAVMSQKAVTEELNDLNGVILQEIGSIVTKENYCVLTKDSVFYQGYITGTGFVATSGGNTQRTSDFIELEKGVHYRCDYEEVLADGSTRNYPRTIIIYNSDKSVSKSVDLPSGMADIYLQNDEKYLRLNYNIATSQVNILRVYPIDIGYEDVPVLNEKIIVPQLPEYEEVDIVQMIGDSETAVMSQKAITEEFDKIVTRLSNCVIDENTPMMQGYLSTATGELIAQGANQHATDFVELEQGVVYVCELSRVVAGSSGDNMKWPDYVCIYDSDKVYVRSLMIPAELDNIALSDTEKYIRLSAMWDELEYLRVYPKDKGYETLALSEDVIIPQFPEIEDIGNVVQTTGDSETAVMSQKAVTEEIDNISGVLLAERETCVLTKDSVFYTGYLTGDGFIATTGGTQRTSDFIELKKGVHYRCEFEAEFNGAIQTYPRAIMIYNADKSQSRGLNLPADMADICLTGNEKYIRLNYNSSQVHVLRIYPIDEGYEPITVFNPNLEVPQVEEMNEQIRRINLSNSGYIHARRPIISFIFDGEYDLNDEVEAKFSEHNMCVGFAPQYTTGFGNNSKATYLEWQEKGHEVLAHGVYQLGEGTVEEEQAHQYIRASYETLSGHGFNVHGYIGSYGKVHEKYVPYIKKYYDYASTEANGSYLTEERCMMFGRNNPYHLYRISLQTSPPEETKTLIDEAISTGGLLLLYGHAQSSNNDYLTVENLETILTYIETVGATVKPPYEAIKDYYSIRYDDIVSLLNG